MPKLLAALPAPILPKPDALDGSAEGDYIRRYDEAIELAELLNDNALAVYNKMCDFWTGNYVVYQWNKKPIPPKPVSPPAYVIDIINGAPEAVLGSDPLADVCPDPPVDTPNIIPVPADPVGEPCGGVQPWYRVKPGDTTPIGQEITNSRGVFTKASLATFAGPFLYFIKKS